MKINTNLNLKHFIMSFDIQESDILQELDDLGASTSDENVILKMKELCILYRKDASDIVSSWVAFATTKGLESDPTMDGLNQLEREQLSKITTKTARNTKTSFSLVPPVYNAQTIDMADGMMDCYETPKRKEGHRRITDNLNTAKEGSPKSVFSPTSYSPSSAKYTGRSGKGSILCSFGSTNNIDWVKKPAPLVQVTLNDPKQSLEKSYQYMFEKLRDRCGVLNDMIEDMAQILQEKHNLEEYSHVRIPQLEEVNVVGRICCDSNGKLNANSVLLEGSLETSSGQVVSVDLSNLSQYALFPGQVVAAKAVNSEGKKLVMKSIYNNEPPNFPTELPKIGPDPLDIVVATGPFTTSDSLSFEPLADLLDYVKKYNPNVLILIGPFVDCKHELIQKGNLNETYEQLFQNQINSLLQSLVGHSTYLILVPSLRDIHHHVIYPTPPYEVNNKTVPKGVSLLCASDPCMLNIQGLVIGITSTDILFHLGKEEIAHPPGLSDRLGRLANHLLTQHSFYPLYPPSDNVNIDYEHMEAYGKMTVRPHVLITPSDLRCFAKDINGCCCINPERLAKGLSGGSFARIRVSQCPTKEESSVIDCISVDICRI